MYPSNGQPPPSSPLQAAYGQPPMAQYATGVPPQPMVSYGKWSTGLCGCCDDVCNFFIRYIQDGVEVWLGRIMES
ncbi:hypothetical protein CTI12_AA610770 [Artemisia annua]|uniref:Uncharacterized protein n=1 Tax=Artemisia annua TaxID=35608 RepID=A0A2U1KF09_ARTAN|nr:hypothetical protein CTI12_AA610770 [Artemisia annua]